ncbi:DUF5677 domain-containing protein [Knoellia sp. GCM10027112]|uniref:DUF5677 domain-containing protein n=1 Tax=Knoellia sp. GCM10027112 TaxID=3273395 RepID=UPI003618D536
MFEHLVHYKEIAGQPDRAEQYEAHQHVTAMQIAERKIGLRLLRGTAARRERERLKKLARSSGERRNAAVAKYGGRFRSGWTAGVSLLDLAKRHGLEPDYEAYRILSGVMHGSSGSLMGTRRTKGDEVTHRLGPDFQLVPIAFLEGMQWWRKLLDELPANGVSADFVLDAMTGADQLLSHYADIHATCWRVDSRTWPEGRVPPRSAAVLAVYASGATKWFSHDPVTQSICLADLVSDEPDYLQDHLGKWRAQAASVPGGRPLTIHVMGVEVKPRPGAAYAPAGSVLNPRDVQERLGLGAG